MPSWPPCWTGTACWRDRTRDGLTSRVPGARSCGPATTAVALGRELGFGADAVEVLIDELQILHGLDVIRWALDHEPERIGEFVRQSRGALARVLG